jgi:ATP-dependent helicase IRC3
MQHRPYQLDCINAILTRRDAGIRRQLVSKGTGLGKTSTFAGLVPHMPCGGQMIVVAHREELVQQAAEEIALWNPTVSIAVDMAEQKADGREDVIVASVQTLGTARSQRLSKYDPARCCWLIPDEAHHATASTYGRIIDHFMVNPAATLVGFTATVNRADGVALGSVFDEIVFQYDMLDGILAGWLSDVHGFMLRTGTDISKIGSSNGDFKEQELTDAVNTPQRNEAIVKAWIDRCWPRQTMVFSKNVVHAKDMCAAFQRQGIRAAYSWGEDKERHSKLALFKSGQLDVIINCQLWLEGFNYKQIECIIPVTPTKSQSKLIQMVGRGTRLGEGIGNLVEWRKRGLLKDTDKTNVVVLDPVDTFGRHSFATLPSLFGLSPNLDLQGASVVAAMSAIKEALAQHPEADVSGLTQLSDLEMHIKQANLWQIRFAEDTKDFSGLQWTKRGDGTYRLLLPKNEYFRIEEDMVGKFTVEGRLKGTPYKHEKLTSLADAVKLVEQTITTLAPEHLILLGREEKWMKSKITAGQMEQLQKLKVPDHQIVQWNRGQAAAYITSRFNKRA